MSRSNVGVPRRWQRALAISALSILLACGGDDDDSDAGKATGADDSSAPTREGEVPTGDALPVACSLLTPDEVSEIVDFEVGACTAGYRSDGSVAHAYWPSETAGYGVRIHVEDLATPEEARALFDADHASTFGIEEGDGFEHVFGPVGRKGLAGNRFATAQVSTPDDGADAQAAGDATEIDLLAAIFAAD